MVINGKFVASIAVGILAISPLLNAGGGENMYPKDPPLPSKTPPPSVDTRCDTLPRLSSIVSANHTYAFRAMLTGAISYSGETPRLTSLQMPFDIRSTLFPDGIPDGLAFFLSVNQGGSTPISFEQCFVTETLDGPTLQQISSVTLT